MNTAKGWVICENSRTKGVTPQVNLVAPLRLPEKHPLDEICLPLQRKAPKRRRSNEEIFFLDLAPESSMAKYFTAQQILRGSQFNVPGQFSPSSKALQRQTQTTAANNNIDVKINGKTSDMNNITRQLPSTNFRNNVSTNAFNPDSSMVADHLDAPENDDQEFSILNIIPSLISEKNRKAAFVENLVDAAGLIIELIWANFSVSPCAKIITLRVFLQETLRRSRTSYSTLQTALFYLFRIKPKIASLSRRSELPLTPTSEYPPNLNQNQNQNNDPATCGRRMFLAALIVASKYLQDRNYSNRAWSKISGLPVNEINKNEICFLKLIDYNLFISEEIFKRWSSLLLTNIQAISGSEISSPDAFRRVENQREIIKFRETLRSIDPKTMDRKRIGFANYPITPAVSAPGSPREHQGDVTQIPTFPTTQRLKFGQQVVDKQSRMPGLDRQNCKSHEHDSQSCNMSSQVSLVSPQATPVFPLQIPPSRSHILPTSTPSLWQQKVLHEQTKKENSVSNFFNNTTYIESKDIEYVLSSPSAARLINFENLSESKNSTELINNVHIPTLQNNCSEITFESCPNNQIGRILLRSSA